MSMHVPDGVRGLFLVLTGEEWPSADEDQLGLLGRAWGKAATRVKHELEPQLTHAVNRIRTTFTGQAELGFADTMAPYSVDKPYYIHSAVEQFLQAETFLEDTSVQVEYVKLISILTLIELLAEIAWAIAASPFTGGASMAWLEGVMEVVKFLMQRWWGRLFVRIVQAEVMGIAFQVAMDGLVQAIQLAEGHRKHWDTKLTIQSVGVGALGGAFAVPFNAIGHRLGHLLGSKLVTAFGKDTAKLVDAATVASAKHVDDLGVKPIREVAEDIARTIDHLAGEPVSNKWLMKTGTQFVNTIEEGLHEAFTEGTYAALSGDGFSFNPFSFTSGAFSSLTNVFDSGPHGGLGPHGVPAAKLGPGGKPPADPSTPDTPDEGPSTTDSGSKSRSVPLEEPVRPASRVASPATPVPPSTSTTPGPVPGQRTAQVGTTEGVTRTPASPEPARPADLPPQESTVDEPVDVSAAVMPPAMPPRQVSGAGQPSADPSTHDTPSQGPSKADSADKSRSAPVQEPTRPAPRIAPQPATQQGSGGGNTSAEPSAGGQHGGSGKPTTVAGPATAGTVQTPSPYREQNLQLGAAHRDAVERGRFPGLRDEPAVAGQPAGARSAKDGEYGRIVSVRLESDGTPHAEPTGGTPGGVPGGKRDNAPTPENDGNHGRIVAVHLVDDGVHGDPGGPTGGAHGGEDGSGSASGGHVINRGNKSQTVLETQNGGGSGTTFGSGGHVINRGNNTQTSLQTPKPGTKTSAPKRIKPSGPPTSKETAGEGQLGSDATTVTQTQTQTQTPTQTATQPKTTAATQTKTTAATAATHDTGAGRPSQPSSTLSPADADADFQPEDRHGVPPPTPRLVLNTPERQAERERAAQESDFQYEDKHGVPPRPRLVLDTPARQAKREAEREQLWQDFVAAARAESPGSPAVLDVPTLAEAHALIDAHTRQAREDAWRTLMSDLGIRPPGETPAPDPTAEADFQYQDRNGVPPPGPRLVLDTPERRAARQQAARDSDFRYQDRHGVPPSSPAPKLVLDTPERRAERMWQEFVATARAESPGGPAVIDVPTLTDAHARMETNTQQAREEAWEKLLNDLGIRLPGDAPTPVPGARTAGPGEPVWFPAPSDGLIHAQAVDAVPRAHGWTTLVAHSEAGRVVDGDTAVDGPGVAERMQLPRLDGGGVVMVVCNAAAPPPGGGRSPAEDLHLATDSATPILAPTHEAMMSGADVVSGTWTVDADGATVPNPVGDWVLWEGGVARALGTSSLTEALAGLGVGVTPGGPPPDAPVGFVHQVTPAQTATANVMQYDAIQQHLATQGFVDFYTALIGATGNRLVDSDGVPMTPAAVHALVQRMLRADLEEPVSHYAGLYAPATDVAQFLVDMQNPAFWSRQASILVPHVVADLFGLDLGVVGALGGAEAVGDVNGPRRGDQHGDPFLVLNVGDRFVGLVPRPVAAGANPPPRELRPRFQPGPNNAWTRPLTAAENGLVDQAGQSAPLQPGVEEHAANLNRRTVAQSLNQHYTALTDAHVQTAATTLTTRIRGALDDWQSPGSDQLRADLEALDRVAQHLGQTQAQLDTTIDTFTRQWLGAFPRPTGPADRQAVERAAELAAAAEQNPALQAARNATGMPPSDLGGRLAQLHQDATSAAAEAATRVENEAAAAVARNVPPGAAEWQPQALAIQQRNAIAAVQGRARAVGVQAFADTVAARLQDAGMVGAIEELATAQVREDRARQAAPWLTDARTRGITARDDYLAPYRQQAHASAAAAMEWQLRQNNAVDALLADEPARFLPPGFGEAGLRAPGQTGPVLPTHPMGRDGRFVRFGDIRVGDHQGLADLVVSLLPNPNPALEAATGQAVLDFLAEHGAQTFARRLLEGGLDLAVRDGAVDENVHIELAFGDLNLTHHLRALATEVTQIGLAIGRKQHFPVEADHESTAGGRKTVSSSRSIGVSANVAWALGGPGHIHGLRFGGAVSGRSTTSYSGGSDAVSATKRLFPLGGHSSYFDVPGAALSVQTRQAAARGVPATRQGINTRLAFPQELTPVRPAGAPSSALPGAPLTLAGSRPVGVDRAQLANEADPNGPLHQAADRVAAAQHEFFNLVESVGGLDQIREQVSAALGNAAGEVEHGMAEGVSFALSEGSFLRMFGDISGPGWTTPLFPTRDQRSGMRLRVTGRLRNAQAVGIDAVPMKEESQRFVNIGQQTGQGAEFSVSVPNFRYGYTFNEHGGIGVEANVSGTLSASRSMSANSGSGHISGLVYNGDSVLYRAEFAIDTDVIRPDTRLGAAERRTVDVAVYLRIPIAQRARFEATVAAAVDPALAPAVPARDVDRAPIDPDADAATVATETRERGRDRHPPLHLASGQGTGFAAISHLSGAERVLPRLEQLVLQAGAPMAWSRRWDEMELAHLRTQLASRFTREGLINWGSALFQDGGVRMELSRPGTEGTEVITVTVTGHFTPPPTAGPVTGPRTAPVPTSSGRVHSAKLEIMPSAFAGAGGGDNVGAGVGFAFSVGGTGNTDHAGALSRITPSVQLGLSRSVSQGTSVTASGFLLEAILYDGPARTFDYDVSFDLDVSVRHVAGTTGLGWPKVIGRRLGLLGEAEQAPQIPPNTRVLGTNRAQDTLTGSTRFVMVEELAPVDRITNQQTLDRVGTVNVHSTGPQPASRTVTIPDVSRYLTGGHTPLTMDDQVMEVLGGARLGNELAQMLDQLGVRSTVYENLPWVLTSAETLGSSMVRGPSVLYHQIVEGGQFYDRVADISITGFPHHDRSDPTRPVDIFQMHVAEGNGAVSSSREVRTSRSAALRLFPLGIADGTTGQGAVGTGVGIPDINISDSGARSESMSLTATTGRLTQGSRAYLEHTADMVWQISVTVRDQNMFHEQAPRSAHSTVRVADGLTFLRLANPVADIRTLGNAVPAPRTPALLHSDQRPALPAGAPPLPGIAQVVRTLPAAPGSTARVPIVPLVPATAASERLIPHTAATGATDVTGEGNSLLDGVRRLLSDHAPGVLESHWTVQEGPPAADGGLAGAHGPRQRQVPQKLANLLNPGSLEALLDVLLGPGLVLHAIRSGPLHNERVQLVLRATRDPNGSGYTYLEHVESANVTRYWFRLNSHGDSASSSRGSGWAHGTSTSLSGASHPERLGGGSARPATDASTSAGRSTGVTVTDAVRDTYFAAGPADRYVGEVELSATLTRTVVPSLAVNALGLSLPRRAFGWYQGVGDHAIQRPTVRVPMLERILVPTELLHDNAVPQPPPAPAPGAQPALGTYAVTEVDPGRTAAELGLPPFALRPADLLAHDAVAFGFDHAKLRILLEQALPRLAGNIDPRGGEHSAVVSRLLEAGTRTQDALYYALSYGMVTRQLEHLLRPEGLDLPTLVREGATFTDNIGELTMRVELANPRLRGYTQGWLESVDYGFREFATSSEESHGRSLGASGGPDVRAGSLQEGLPPYSSAPRTAGEGLNVSFGRNRGDRGTGVLKTMPRSFASNREVPWLRTDVDAIVHLTLSARNERDLLHGTGGEVTVSFHLAHALELGVSPELALSLGLVHPQGVPVPSGVFVPAISPQRDLGVPDDTRDSVSAAFALPSAPNVFAVHVRVDANGQFIVGDRTLTADQFNRQVLSRYELTPQHTLVLVTSGGDRAPATVGTSTAPPPPSAAAALAEATGLPVMATTHDVFVTRDGSALAGIIPGPRHGAPHLNDLQRGSWRLITSNGPGQPPHWVVYWFDLAQALADSGIPLSQRPRTVPPAGRIVRR
jgi:hypothetical protein